MALFEWSDKYSVNIKEIDQEHKQLVDMLNMLYASMKSGHGSEVVGPILTKMVQYAATHFVSEEKHMITYGFHGYAEHKAEHEAFIAKAYELLDRHQHSTAISIETGYFLRDWLQNHIMGTDKLYGPYLNSKGVY